MKVMRDIDIGMWETSMQSQTSRNQFYFPFSILAVLDHGGIAMGEQIHIIHEVSFLFSHFIQEKMK